MNSFTFFILLVFTAVIKSSLLKPAAIMYKNMHYQKKKYIT